jgi:hypothetical protein
MSTEERSSLRAKETSARRKRRLATAEEATSTHAPQQNPSARKWTSRRLPSACIDVQKHVLNVRKRQLGHLQRLLPQLKLKRRQKRHQEAHTQASNSRTLVPLGVPFETWKHVVSALFSPSATCHHCHKIVTIADSPSLQMYPGARVTTCSACSSASVVCVPQMTIQWTSMKIVVQTSNMPPIHARTCGACGFSRDNDTPDCNVLNVRVLSTTPVPAWRYTSITTWSCPQCECDVCVTLSDLAHVGLVAVECEVTQAGTIIMSQSKQVTLLEHETIAFLGELRFGAHATAHGFWGAASAVADHWGASLKPNISRQLQTSILRVVTLYMKCLFALRDDIEPKELAACYACSQVPSDGTCQDDGNPHCLGGASSLISDGGSFASSRFIKAICLDNQHKGNSTPSQPRMSQQRNYRHHDQLDEVLKEGLILVQDTSRLREWLRLSATPLPAIASGDVFVEVVLPDEARPGDCLTFNVPQHGSLSAEVPAGSAPGQTIRIRVPHELHVLDDDTPACGDLERKMLADNKPMSLSAFDSNDATQTVMVALCSHCHLFRQSMVMSPGHENHAMADCVLDGIFSHPSFFPQANDSDVFPAHLRGKPVITTCYDLECRRKRYFFNRWLRKHGSLHLREGYPISVADVCHAMCVDAFHAHCHTWRCMWSNCQFRQSGTGTAFGSQAEIWMHVANGYKNILRDLHPAQLAAHLDLIGQVFNRVHSDALVRCLQKKLKKNGTQAIEFALEYARWEAQFEQPNGQPGFTTGDVDKWSADLKDAGVTHDAYQRAGTATWTPYDKLAAAKWRLVGIDATINGGLRPPWEDRHLYKYLHRMPWVDPWHSWDDLSRTALSKLQRRVQNEVNTLEARCRADDGDAFATHLEASTANLPILMLMEVQPWLEGAFLELSTTRSALSANARASSKAQQNRDRARQQRQLKAYKALLSINNAWIVRANEQRFPDPASRPATFPKATLAEGYAYMDEVRYLSPEFDGVFPMGRDLPADGACPIPLPTRQCIVRIRDRLARIDEDIVITTHHVWNLLRVLKFRKAKLESSLTQALGQGHLGIAVLMQHELARTAWLIEQHQAAFPWNAPWEVPEDDSSGSEISVSAQDTDNNSDTD